LPFQIQLKFLIDAVMKYKPLLDDWQAFSAGVADLQVEEGQLIIELRE